MKHKQGTKSTFMVSESGRNELLHKEKEGTCFECCLKHLDLVGAYSLKYPSIGFNLPCMGQQML